MEQADQGDLLTYLRNAQSNGLTLEQAELQHMVKGIMNGLEHLHHQRVCIVLPLSPDGMYLRHCTVMHMIYYLS